MRERSPALEPGLLARLAPPAALVVAQWAAVAVFAAAADHDGWFYVQAGDASSHYAGAWLLSQGLLPVAADGYLWSALLAPVALFAGPNVLDALPVVVPLQVALLLPVAALCVYDVARRIGGKTIGLAAGAAWIALPFVALPLFDARYHERYADQFLPQALGLTAMPDFPGMVAVLVAATFAFRALESGRAGDALAAGLAAGVAAGIDPANLLFFPAPVVALALARRWRGLALTCLGLLPALVTLVVWKQRTGDLAPLFTADLDWSRLAWNEDLIREFFWSVRLLEWAALAGIVAVARRSLSGAALLATWLVVFVLARGGSPGASVETTSFFRFLMPAFPAFFLLAVSVPLLLPRLGGRLAARGRAAVPATRGTSAVAAVLLVLAAAPLPIVAAANLDAGASVVILGPS